MNTWEKIEYGIWRVLHPFGNMHQYVKEQNPCAHATLDWWAVDPRVRGYVWYYKHGIRRSEYYHGHALISLSNAERDSIISRADPA